MDKAPTPKHGMDLVRQVKLDLTHIKEPSEVRDVPMHDPVGYVLLRKVKRNEVVA
jgi:hypothetical protein